MRVCALMTTHGTEVLQGDETRKRSHNGARTTDVNAHEQRLPRLRKVRKKHRCRNVANDLRKACGNEERLLPHQAGQELVNRRDT